MLQGNIQTPCAPPSTPLRSAQDVAFRNGMGEVDLNLAKIQSLDLPSPHRGGAGGGVSRRKCKVQNEK